MPTIYFVGKNQRLQILKVFIVSSEFMSQFTHDEFKRIRDFVKKKALHLMRHGEKNYAIVGVPYQNYKLYQIGERLFYSIQTNTFKVIVDDFLIRSQELTPEKFGTGDAIDVIEALLLINPIYDIETFTEFLGNEKCTYILESEKGAVLDRILRLDLFRILRPNEQNKNEFVGGLFHALKHFSKNGINYTTGKSNHELNHPHDLVREIIDAFFIEQGVFQTEQKYVVLKELNENYFVKYVFYRENNTGVFFLKTAYKRHK